MSIQAEIEATKVKLARLERRAIEGTCAELGCDWQDYGGTNAGCELGNDCGCSVPVNVCSRCGDCDYGENKWAIETRAECARERAE